MGSVSYSAHISNGKSAITSKSKLQGVAKHNLRKYKSDEYSSNNIELLVGTDNLYQDVRNVYYEEFDDVVKKYNDNQKREDRRIDDYFDHVAELDQDMAVEIIFQCGDKEFWEEHEESKDKMYSVYRYTLSRLRENLPDFKVANAVIHFDEASPHMHVVGVPVWSGAKKGLSKKVSKRNVFTPSTLSTILQDKLREEVRSCFRFNIKEMIGEKKKGRNHDLSVAEYKIKQELENLKELRFEKEQTSKSIDSAKRQLKVLEVQYSEKSGELEYELTDKKEIAKKLDNDLLIKRAVVRVYDDEIKEKNAFLELIDAIKRMIQNYLPLQPAVELFANTVERGENIVGGNWNRGILSELGRLLLSFKEIVQAGFCWFPRLMKWNTSMGEVAPVFRDDPDGYSYKLEGFRSIETKAIYRVENLKDEICSENRIGTLEQIQGSIDMLERQIDKQDYKPDKDLRK
ncbi:MAG TPA: plasmid recombination protein [Mobilitalea sp.]|nr:plasmid recombination protein [Mobilitalea sp.]